jgi:lysophospholipase L1-like esterase
MKYIRIVLLLLILTAFNHREKKNIKIFMAGDSTMAIKTTRAFPETGWGMPFVHFWDSSATVINMAKNGASTRTFREDGLWQSILQQAGPGDYVFIQFGHNDEVPAKKSYTTPEEFKYNLKKFIGETRNKGATPILLTPVARRRFDSTGLTDDTHKAYAALVNSVAADENVLSIDHNQKSLALYQQLGVEQSKMLFLHLRKDEHPNYPDGKEDNTHFSELGARLVAELVLQEIREKIPVLAERIISRKSY